MSEEDQEATPEPEAGPTSDADELSEFLREFPEYGGTEIPAGASDFLDIGLPSAAGAARSATDAASLEADKSTEEADLQAEAEEEPAVELGAAISLRQLDALLDGDVVGASLPDEAIQEKLDEEAELPPSTDEDTEGEAPDEILEAAEIEDVEIADLADETEMTASNIDSEGPPPPVEEPRPGDSEAGSVVEGDDPLEADLDVSMDADDLEPPALESDDVASISVGGVGEASEEISGESELLDDNVGGVADDTVLAEALSAGDGDESTVDQEGGSEESGELTQQDVDALLAGVPEDDATEPAKAAIAAADTTISSDELPADADSGSAELSQEDIDALLAGASEDDATEPAEAAIAAADTTISSDELPADADSGSAELSQEDIDALLAGSTGEDAPEPAETVMQTSETAEVEDQTTEPDGAGSDLGELSQEEIDALLAGASEVEIGEGELAAAELPEEVLQSAASSVEGIEDIVDAVAPEEAEAESQPTEQDDIDALFAAELGEPTVIDDVAEAPLAAEATDELGTTDIDASDLSEEDLLAALGAEEIAVEGDSEPFLLEQSELDSLTADAEELGEGAGSGALAAAFADVSVPDFGTEATEDEPEEIPVIQAGGGGILGLPTFAWLGIGMVPVVLILSIVAYAVFGRPSAPAVAAITPAVEVTPAADATATADPTEAPPSPTVEPTAVSVATTVATTAPTPPILSLPKFVFSDPNEDGINPDSGQPRRNVFPGADIIRLEIDTSGSNGQITTGGVLTEDGFAGPASSLEIIVTFRGPLSEVGGVVYRLDVYGRFKGAEPDELAPAGIDALAEGSQVAFSVSNDNGSWIAEQNIWNQSLNSAVRVGDFTDFAIVQNWLRISIPSPLLTQLMPAGLEKDDFQFFVRVGYTSDRTAVRDEVGRLDRLVLSDPDLVEIEDSLQGGKLAEKLRSVVGLSELQPRLVSHVEQRARALLSASDPAYLLAQPVAR